MMRNIVQRVKKPLLFGSIALVCGCCCILGAISNAGKNKALPTPAAVKATATQRATVPPTATVAQPSATAVAPTATAQATATTKATAVAIVPTATKAAVVKVVPTAAPKPTSVPQPTAAPVVDASASAPCKTGQIKGSQNGIYHVPGGRDYKRTKKNVTCFDTVDAAKAAGFVPSEAP